MATKTAYTAWQYPNNVRYFRGFIKCNVTENAQNVVINGFDYGIEIKGEGPKTVWFYKYVPTLAGGGGSTGDNTSSAYGRTTNANTTDLVHSTAGNAVTVTKTHSAQTKTIKVAIDVGAATRQGSGGSAYHIASVQAALNNYNSRKVEGYTATATITVSIPAKAKYTVSYNANGGTGAPASQTKWYGENLTLSGTAPTKSGYKFAGWRGSDGRTYAVGATYTGNAALTLTANWTYIHKEPIISNVKVERCTSGGTLDDSGTYAKVTCKVTPDSGDSSTISSVTVKVGTDSAVAATVSSGLATAIVGGSLIADQSYPVTITATDNKSATKTFSTFVPTAYYPMDFSPDGRGVAFGGSATSGQFDIFDMELSAPNHIDGIVEQGTSGYFRYRKWASGFLEVWYYKSHGTVAVNLASAAYGGYRSGAQTVSMPSGLLKTVAGGIVAKCNTNSIFVRSFDFSTTQFRFFLASGESTTGETSIINGYFWGTWK